MMWAVIDFRYHVVSLVAVFLALAIGIVLGAGPLQNTLGEQLSVQVDSLRDERNTALQDLADMQELVDSQLEFIDLLGPAVVDGLLAGSQVAVVTVGHVSPEALRAVTDGVADAGGQVTALAAVTPTWLDIWAPEGHSAHRSQWSRLSTLLTARVSEVTDRAAVMSVYESLGMLLGASVGLETEGLPDLGNKFAAAGQGGQDQVSEGSQPADGDTAQGDTAELTDADSGYGGDGYGVDADAADGLDNAEALDETDDASDEADGSGEDADSQEDSQEMAQEPASPVPGGLSPVATYIRQELMAHGYVTFDLQPTEAVDALILLVGDLPIAEFALEAAGGNQASTLDHIVAQIARGAARQLPVTTLVYAGAGPEVLTALTLQGVQPHGDQALGNSQDQVIYHGISTVSDVTDAQSRIVTPLAVSASLRGEYGHFGAGIHAHALPVMSPRVIAPDNQVVHGGLGQVDEGQVDEGLLDAGLVDVGQDNS